MSVELGLDSWVAGLLLMTCAGFKNTILYIVLPNVYMQLDNGLLMVGRLNNCCTCTYQIFDVPTSMGIGIFENLMYPPCINNGIKFLALY